MKNIFISLLDKYILLTYLIIFIILCKKNVYSIPLYNFVFINSNKQNVAVTVNLLINSKI